MLDAGEKNHSETDDQTDQNGGRQVDNLVLPITKLWVIDSPAKIIDLNSDTKDRPARSETVASTRVEISMNRSSRLMSGILLFRLAISQFCRGH